MPPVFGGIFCVRIARYICTMLSVLYAPGAVLVRQKTKELQTKQYIFSANRAKKALKKKT